LPSKSLAARFSMLFLDLANSSNFDSKLKIYSLANATCSKMSDMPYQLLKLWEPRVFFSIEEKLFREVPRPDCVDKWAYIMVGVLGEQLCMLSKYNTDIEIWVMSDYGKKDSRTKNFCHSCIDYNEQYPLCFANHGKNFLKDFKDLLLYDPEKKSAKNVKIHGIMDWFVSYAVVTYVPSLVSLQSGTYMGTGQEVDGEVKRYLKGGVLRPRS
ncbi:hypothetical protein AQUCO_02200268v1, partial [Aquilegia coerulea]